MAGKTAYRVLFASVLLVATATQQSQADLPLEATAHQLNDFDNEKIDEELARSEDASATSSRVRLGNLRSRAKHALLEESSVAHNKDDDNEGDDASEEEGEEEEPESLVGTQDDEDDTEEGEDDDSEDGALVATHDDEDDTEEPADDAEAEDTAEPTSLLATSDDDDEEEAGEGDDEESEDALLSTQDDDEASEEPAEASEEDEPESFVSTASDNSRVDAGGDDGGEFNGVGEKSFSGMQSSQAASEFKQQTRNNPHAHATNLMEISEHRSTSSAAQNDPEDEDDEGSSDDDEDADESLSEQAESFGAKPPMRPAEKKAAIEKVKAAIAVQEKAKKGKKKMLAQTSSKTDSKTFDPDAPAADAKPLKRKGAIKKAKGAAKPKDKKSKNKKVKKEKGLKRSNAIRKKEAPAAFIENDSFDATDE